MSWEFALNPSPTHWIFDYILSKRFCDGRILGEAFEFQITNNYPILDHINIYRVYEDKYARLHYFSFSNKEVIAIFQASVEHFKGVTVKENPKYPRCRVKTITLGRSLGEKFIYCLPVIQYKIRSPA